MKTDAVSCLPPKPSVALISDEPEKTASMANAIADLGFDVTLLPTVCPGIVINFYEDGKRDMDLIDQRLLREPESAPYFGVLRNAPFAIASEHDLREALTTLRPDYVLLPDELKAVEFDTTPERMHALADECGASSNVVSGGVQALMQAHATRKNASNLFGCYAQDYATLPAAANDDLTCPILGGQYDKARMKFMAAQEPPEGMPARFVIRIKSNSFSEYPNPRNIDEITMEMRQLFAQHGITPVGEPKVCWRAKRNDMWMEDEHIHPSDHENYAQVMEQKSYQVVYGEAFVAFEISPNERDKLPAMQQAIDALIKQRESERASSRNFG